MNRIGLLIAALLVLIGVAWLSGVFDSEYSTVAVPEWDLDRDRIERFSLASPSDTVTIAREEGSWSMVAPVEGAVDSVKLNGFLGEVEELTFASVVSTNPDRHGRYGVDSSASSIAMRVDGDDRVLFVGNTGADYRTVYVRVAGDDRVFATRGRVTVDAKSDSWRDRTIINVPRDEVTRVEVVQSDVSFAVMRDGGAWLWRSNQEEVPADSSAASRWIRRFAPLKGDRFGETDTFDQGTLAGRLSFTTLGGSTVALEIRETDTELLARKPGSNDILSLSLGLKPSVLPDPETLR